MTVLGHLFNIVIFLSFIGSIFSVLLLFAKKLLHGALPLWFTASALIFYLLPIIAPSLYLVPPEEASWRLGYRIACVVWAVGAAVFFLY